VDVQFKIGNSKPLKQLLARITEKTEEIPAHLLLYEKVSGVLQPPLKMINP